jgi:hypothetical protein
LTVLFSFSSSLLSVSLTYVTFTRPASLSLSISTCVGGKRRKSRLHSLNEDLDLKENSRSLYFCSDIHIIRLLSIVIIIWRERNDDDDEESWGTKQKSSPPLKERKVVVFALHSKTAKKHSKQSNQESEGRQNICLFPRKTRLSFSRPLCSFSVVDDMKSIVERQERYFLHCYHQVDDGKGHRRTHVSSWWCCQWLGRTRSLERKSFADTEHQTPCFGNRWMIFSSKQQWARITRQIDKKRVIQCMSTHPENGYFPTMMLSSRVSVSSSGMFSWIPSKSMTCYSVFIVSVTLLMKLFDIVWGMSSTLFRVWEQEERYFPSGETTTHQFWKQRTFVVPW